VIILSLVLMLTAEIVSVVGYLRKDYRTIIGAVLSIISGKRFTTRFEHVQVEGENFVELWLMKITQ